MTIFQSLYVFWVSNGTKVLGSISAFLGSVQTAMLVMTPPPPADPMFTAKQMAIVAGLNAFFGAWTVKRGFVNSSNQQPVE
jgi:hypothetical protein